MSFLLDTNVISELRRRRKSNEPLFRWRDSVEGAQTYISVITVLELEFGAKQALWQNAPHAALLRRWIDADVLVEYRDAILPVDVPVAQRCAGLQRIRTFPHNDALIAATALVHDLTVITRDVWDFEDAGVRLLNPWDA